MKLQFLGTVYHHNPFYIETMASEVSGKFLGNTYQLRSSILPRQLCSKNLKYRGVSYQSP